jgi:nucleotide-binding universal stress UspA family protein
MIRHILLPTDGSQRSRNAIRYGIKLARALRARVTGLHVIPPFHPFTYRPQMLLAYHAALAEDSEAAYRQATLAFARRYLQVIARAAAAAGVRCRTLHIEDDQPFQAILATAKKQRCDLILMASHGYSGIGAVLLGSETQKVLTHSPIPVLVYR